MMKMLPGRKDMKMANLLEADPEFSRVTAKLEELCRTRKEKIARLEQLEAELSKARPKVDGQTAWDAALDGCVEESGTKTALMEELRATRENLVFLDEAIHGGTQARVRIHDRLSVPICAEARPAIVREIKRILAALKAISQANEALVHIRTDLEAGGTRTSSLPWAQFTLDAWDDPHGGIVVAYRRFISEAYSEVADAAEWIAKSARRLRAK